MSQLSDITVERTFSHGHCTGNVSLLSSTKIENFDFQKLTLRIRERFGRMSASQIEIENLIHRLQMERDEEDLRFDDYAKKINQKCSKKN